MDRLDAVSSLKYFVPEVVLVFTLMAVLVADLISKNRATWERRLVIVLPSLFGLVVALYYAIRAPEAAPMALFSNMVAYDGFGNLLRILFIVTSIIILLFTIESRELRSVHHGELLVLLLTVTVALIWMANSINLLMIFLALETVSVASYIMVGYLKTDRLSNEASLKYILFGAVSTGTMLFGMSLLYGLTGSLDLFEIRAALMSEQAVASSGPALMVIIVLVLAGIGFKMATVPFHFWCPDVYTGAPTPVTALLSVGPKVAGFAVLVRFFYGGMASPSGPAGEGTWTMVGSVDWQTILMGISILTMTLGNIAALLQTNLKRLLAYSSIAHAGYIMMGAVALSDRGIKAMLAYVVVYLFMNLGAFLVIIVVHNSTGSFDIKGLRGYLAPFAHTDDRHGSLSLLLDGHPPLRRLPREVVCLRRRDPRRFLVVGRHRRPEQRDWRLLLHQDIENHVHRRIRYAGGFVATRAPSHIRGFAFRSRRA